MSAIEEKILGKNKKPEKRSDYFNRETVWKVTVKDCGTTLTNGTIVAEMLDYKTKLKVMDGLNNFSYEKFLFERV